MSNNYKFWTGVLAFLPLVMMAIYFYYMFVMVFGMMELQSRETYDPPFESFRTMFGLVLLLMITTFGVMIFYIIHIVNNKKIDSNERLMWVLLVVFANAIVTPIYWFMRIFKNQGNQTGSQDFSSHTFTR